MKKKKKEFDHITVKDFCSTKHTTKLRELNKWGTLQHVISTKETKKEKIAIPTGKIEKCEFEQI